VRVRFRVIDREDADYYWFGGSRTDFAIIETLILDPGCPWNMAWPASVHLLLRCPDLSARYLRLGLDSEL
jgi:hypothetical protein